MNILADENVDRVIVEWLRSAGHDVVWVAESDPSCDDGFVLRAASAQGRILLTNDLDFGERVYLRREAAYGVVTMRIRAASAAELLSRFQAHWAAIERHAPGRFVVVHRDRLRVRPL